MDDLEALTSTVGDISLNENDSFLYRHLETREFVTLGTRADFGRVAVATKDVAVGTNILCEKPILVYEEGSIEDMISRFLDLDQESRDAVLSMHHPSAPSSTILFEGFMIANAFSIDPSLIHKLLGIDRCNSRVYDGSEAEIYFRTQSALFLFLSKLTHSCNPNTVLTKSRDDGKMKCEVVRPIQTGDLITYSHFGHMVELPYPLKHKWLLHEKGIICRCPQCVGADYARPVCCKKCRGGILLCTNSHEGNSSWTCSICGSLQVQRRIETLEMEAEDDLAFFEISNKVGNPICSRSAVRKKIEIYAKELHPQHYSTLNFMQLFIELCIEDAMAIEIMAQFPLLGALRRRDSESVFQIRSEAAKMGATLVERVEHIAAGSICPASTRRCNQNEPVPYAYKYASLLAKLMMQCPLSMWPANGRHIVHRYIPIMKVMFGEEKKELIVDIQRCIPAPSNRDSEVIPLATPTVPVAAEKRAKQRRKKRGRKKGRKR